MSFKEWFFAEENYDNALWTVALTCSFWFMLLIISGILQGARRTELEEKFNKIKTCAEYSLNKTTGEIEMICKPVLSKEKQF